MRNAEKSWFVKHTCNIKALRVSIQHSTSKETIRGARQLGISYHSVQQILHPDFLWFPFPSWNLWWQEYLPIFHSVTSQSQYLFLQLLPVGLLEQVIAHEESKHINDTWDLNHPTMMYIIWRSACQCGHKHSSWRGLESDWWITLNMCSRHNSPSFCAPVGV